jgi:membrane-associated phospholipid phosphatase
MTTDAIIHCMPFSSELSFVLAAQQALLSSSLMVALAIFCARWLVYANILLAFYLFWPKIRRDRHAVFEAAWSLVLALILVSLIAHFVGRDRPYLASTDVRLLIPPPFNTSFPSGHTAAAVAVALAFVWRNRWVGVASLVIACIVAFSRVLVGVHYPSDLLGGIVVGAISFALVRFFHGQLARRDIGRSVARHHGM